jgi:hypothetical protein
MGGRASLYGLPLEPPELAFPNFRRRFGNWPCYYDTAPYM